MDSEKEEEYSKKLLLTFEVDTRNGEEGVCGQRKHAQHEKDTNTLTTNVSSLSDLLKNLQ